MIHHISPERLTIERVGEIIDKHMTLALSEESAYLRYHYRFRFSMQHID